MYRQIQFGVLLLWVACSVQATPITFSFLNDIWTNPSGTQMGFASQTAAGAANSSTGTVSKNGLTLSFAGSFFGDAVSSDVSGSNGQGPSFTNATSTNPLGFIFGTKNDGNPISFTATSFSGNVEHYQRWDFSFSEPVVLNSFILQDIDSDGASGGFRDMIAGEAFFTATPGVVGTGLGANYSFFGTTSLLSGSVNFGGNPISSVGAPLGLGNPNNTPEVRVELSFGTTAISSFSVYAFSDRDANHRLSLDRSSFEVNTAVPEPGSALLAGLALVGGLVLRRKS